jgi:hypothetical protein
MRDDEKAAGYSAALVPWQSTYTCSAPGLDISVGISRAAVRVRRCDAPDVRHRVGPHSL